MLHVVYFFLGGGGGGGRVFLALAQVFVIALGESRAL